MAKYDNWLYGGSYLPTPQSSWVAGIRYEYDVDTLEVTFISGVTCAYNVDANIAIGMWQASSKGRFVWANLYHLPYSIV